MDTKKKPRDIGAFYIFLRVTTINRETYIVRQRRNLSIQPTCHLNSGEI